MTTTHSSRLYRVLAQPLQGGTRLTIALLVIPLLLSLLQPLWTIRMLAPQYPDGLRLDIYAYTIQGGNEGRDLPEINTLNHYIGMQKLDRADFTDLDWIPFAIGVLALLALRVAAIGEVRSLVDLAVMTLYFALFSAGRFVFKLWTYGHNLDPQAPIDIEPFMPAILGSKEIGNFVTQGYPLSGTFLLGIFITGVTWLALWNLRGWVSRPSRAPAPAHA